MDDYEKRKMRAQALRYKRAALATMGYDTIIEELEAISSECDDLRWAEENCTEPVLDGDEDEGAGYRMDFSELSADCERLLEQLYEASDMFDDCTVALIGNRFECIGYDSMEADYYSLCSYDAGRAAKESGKRLMRMTKADMLDTIGRNVGILMAFYDIRQRYDYLRAALNVVLDHNMDTLHTVRSIEDAYTKWSEDGCYNWGESYRALDSACKALDDIYWIA